MEQLSLDPVVNHGVTKKLRWWAGYTFGYPKCLKHYERYCSGVVLTPRYAEQFRRELNKCGDIDTPILLDNGAWPAFRDGKSLYVDDMLDDIERAVDILNGQVRWAIFPDDVGNPNTTTRRLERSFRRRDLRVKWLISIQEGMDLRTHGHLARHVGGVFIGGKTLGWKIETATKLRKLYPDLYIHVGRISAESHLHAACVAGVDSFDTTTYMMGIGSNQFTNYEPRLRRYCKRFLPPSMLQY